MSKPNQDLKQPRLQGLNRILETWALTLLLGSLARYQDNATMLGGWVGDRQIWPASFSITAPIPVLLEGIWGSRLCGDYLRTLSSLLAIFVGSMKGKKLSPLHQQALTQLAAKVGGAV